MAKWGKVIDVTEVMRPGPALEMEKFYRYTVTSKGGITFTEEIPEAETTPEEVDKILGARAEQLDKTKSL